MAYKKVLCIVDTYPSESNKSTGNTYQEQLYILKEQLDMEVIVLDGQRTSLSKWFKKKISFVGTDFDERAGVRVHRFIVHNPFSNPWLRNFAKLNRWVLSKHIDTVASELTDFCKQNLKIKPEVIYPQTAQYLMPFAVPLKKKMKAKLIAMEHYPVFAPMTDLWNVDDEFRRQVLSDSLQVERFMVVSHYLSSVMSNLGFRNKFEVVGNFVSTHEIRPKQPKSEFKVLYIGYDFHIKDPHTFFQAIEKVKREDPTVRFIIVNGVDSFDKYLKQYDVADVVDIRYKLKYAEVIQIMQNEADVLVSTSMAETFGMAMAEAIVCGLPLICTNSGGNMDFVNAENCLMVDKKSPEQLANRILELKSGKHSFNFAENRRKVIEEFDSTAFQKKFLAQLNSI